MKTKLFTLAIVALFAVSAKAQFGGAGLRQQEAFTNSYYRLETAVATNITTPTNQLQFRITPGKGVSVAPKIVGTNAGTANVTFYFDFSVDGTRWVTRAPVPLTYQIAQNGTTVVNGFTNFPPTLIDNYTYIRCYLMTNAHTDSIFVSNLTFSAP